MNSIHRTFGALAHWFHVGGNGAGQAARAPTELEANFGAFVANGFFFPIAGKILGTGLLLTWFVTDLTSSAFVAGLLIPIQYGVSLLAQPWIGQRMSERPGRVRYYVYQSMFRAAVWIGLGVSAVAIGPDHPTLLLTVFFGVVLADAVGAGVGNIAFSETLARA